MKNDFCLDTTNFHLVIEEFERLSQSLRVAKFDFDNLMLKACENWDGEGRNKFDSLHRNMGWQLNDLVEFTWGMYEDFVTASESYIEADLAMQKSLAGQVNRY